MEVAIYNRFKAVSKAIHKLMPVSGKQQAY